MASFLDHVWRLHGRLDEAVAGNVTQANVATYIAELGLRVASVTLHGSIAKLRRTSEILCPTGNYCWLRDIENDLAMDMWPVSKFYRMVDSQVIVSAGLGLMHWVDTAACSQVRQAELYRNGLMIALLAVCPIRLKNFASIEIARNLIPVERSWHIALQAAETKEGRPDERPLPSFLTPFINRYLEHYRSVFGHPGSALWVGRYHNAMTANAVARILTETTRQLPWQADLATSVSELCRLHRLLLLRRAAPSRFFTPQPSWTKNNRRALQSSQICCLWPTLC